MAEDAGTAREAAHAGCVVTTTTLNSRQLTGAVIKRVARPMELPMAAALEDLQQMIDGELVTRGKDPMDVQVVQKETETARVIKLHDSTGCFLTIEPDPEVERTGQTDNGEPGDRVSRTVSPDGHDDTGGEPPGEDPSVAELQRDIMELKEENSALTAEVSELRKEIQEEKSKYREFWKLNCMQLREWDEIIEGKNAEIGKLQKRVALLESPKTATARVPHTHSPSGVPPVLEHARTAPTPTPTEPVLARRGKAPPVDPFDGETGSVPFEDWLPSLQRVAAWNGWTEDDCLVQLAGHLRKCALQEWNLFTAEERSTFALATNALQNRLDPHSRILSAQDFRHAVQHDDETVSDSIRQLEQIYRKAYGRENMSNKTRDTLLFGQLQKASSMQ